MDGQIKLKHASVLVIGAGELLTNKMFVFDGLSMNGRIAKLPSRNPRCCVWG